MRFFRSCSTSSEIAGKKTRSQRHSSNLPADAPQPISHRHPDGCVTRSSDRIAPTYTGTLYQASMTPTSRTFPRFFSEAVALLSQKKGQIITMRVSVLARNQWRLGKNVTISLDQVGVTLKNFAMTQQGRCSICIDFVGILVWLSWSAKTKALQYFLLSFQGDNLPNRSRVPC